MEKALQSLQALYTKLGLQQEATLEHLYVITGVLGFLFLLILIKVFKKADEKIPSEFDAQKKAPAQAEEASKLEITKEAAEEITAEKETEVAAKEQAVVEEVVEATPEEVSKEVAKEEGPSWTDRLRKGLGQSRNQVWGRIGKLFSGTALDEDTLEEVEELLYGADIGPATVAELIEELEEKAKSEGFGEKEFKSFLFDFLSQKMDSIQNTVDKDLYQFNPENKGKTKVIMVVGVNGAGKTTTIGKLATKLTNQGAKVVVGACDTFRAAAVDQLQVWCDRAGATMIRAREGANPSGVGYDALQTAMNENADYCILDTAGRLHTAGNLMEELTKSKNVLKKLDDSAPDQVLLVIDAITGQNALRQAEEFNKALGLTGLIFTKCDGSSKAGSAVSIVQQLKVPITYIGVGENVEDLNVFSLKEYLNALLDY
ncbi:signal recognition particle-docking protein FtsY [Halobacteriovorax sp. GB3]|uniref:signal recognition particle-docking protein FtsY n=1 Tax=Halobacteriovorax sp. GB3 TaxID=2719615 RepID=UPI00235E96E0|nr:signal recognition particle-docking protein FtsY [Halobacteriovorax sp. GB3]MDD0854430.1 signal recognition particle-docking protein FtsY [Halobacteriovorax sp. GB3]